MKSLLSILFILFQVFLTMLVLIVVLTPLSFSNVDKNIEFNKAKKLIYKKNYEKGLKILKDIKDKLPFGYSKADLYNYIGFASRKQKTQITIMLKIII